MSVKWTQATVPTLSDLVTAEPGDNVYFFSSRKVYGIGEIVEIQNDVVVAENHSGATNGKAYVQAPKDFGPLVDDGHEEGKIQRWVIACQPAPFFFANGVNMDDLLASNEEAIKILRVFWKRSFIKFGDEENRAFKAAILRRNRDCLLQHPADGRIFECDTSKSLISIRKGVVKAPDIPALLLGQRKRDGSLRSESYLELGLLDQLAKHDAPTEKGFGRADYLSH